ncbi:hypothetical protein LUZ60_009817 [Juncus effusus]|nr:hypothetical protein LUZ60_009817 [Juncus effusus]
MKSSGSNSSSNGNEGLSPKVERKTIEKNRRMHMKNLCLKLSSLIPEDHFTNCPKDIMTQLDNLDEAASYILKLKEKIESLKEKRELEKCRIASDMSNEVAIGITLPIIEVRYQETKLEVVLISSLYKKFIFHKVIRIIEEEGAEVINASLSAISDKVIYTIHSQACSSRIGLEPSQVSQRIKESI